MCIKETTFQVSRHILHMKHERAIITSLINSFQTCTTSLKRAKRERESEMERKGTGRVGGGAGRKRGRTFRMMQA